MWPKQQSKWMRNSVYSQNFEGAAGKHHRGNTKRENSLECLDFLLTLLNKLFFLFLVSELAI